MKNPPQVLYCLRCGRRTDPQFQSLLPRFTRFPPEIMRRCRTLLYSCPKCGFGVAPPEGMPTNL